LPAKADVVIGGFPCQDISVNGKMEGIRGKRSCLYTSIVEAVRKIQPKVFVAENVGGLLLKTNADSLKQILTDFNSLGYNVTYNLYHAADYGVPQTRERVFIVGTKKDLPEFKPPDPVCKKYVTVKEATLKRLRKTGRLVIYGALPIKVPSRATVKWLRTGRATLSAPNVMEIYSSTIYLNGEFLCARRRVFNHSPTRFFLRQNCGRLNAR
jgi:DNA-cytosine methyltransferase